MEIVIGVMGLLLVVLVVAGAMIVRQFDELRKLQSSHSVNPILEIKRRFDAGELTREEFELKIQAELEQSHADRSRRRAS